MLYTKKKKMHFEYKDTKRLKVKGQGYLSGSVS